MGKQSPLDPQDPSLQQKVRQYIIAARRLPSEADQNPKVIQMRIFAPNAVRAQSRFWYQMKRLNKLKKANGEFIFCREVYEKGISAVHTYGIVIKYESRRAYHNMYREFRDVSLAGAVSQLYSYMSGNHRANPETIHIIRTTVVQSYKDTRRPRNYQLSAPRVKFPIIKTLPKQSRRFRTTFKANRPVLNK